MIRNKLHPSLLLLYAFLAFWLFFAIQFRIREVNRIAGDFANIKKEGVLRVCGEQDLFSFYVRNDSVYGFYYEMMKAFADRHELKLVYMGESSLSKRIQRLKDNECDVLGGPLPVTIDLRKQIEFTKSILESKLMLIQRAQNLQSPGRVVRDQIDFGGMTIHICDNQAYLQRLHHLAAEISDTIHIRTMVGFDSERLLAQVQAGLIEYAACDKQVAKAYADKFPDIDMETPVGFNQMQAWGVKPGRTALLDSLNVFIVEYKQSQAFSDLIRKYITNRLPAVHHTKAE
jgi:membrane-bound lytic murein transglycosylase F